MWTCVFLNKQKLEATLRLIKTPSSFWTPGSEGQIGEIVLNNVGHLIWAAATTEAQRMETFLDDMLKKKHISGF